MGFARVTHAMRFDLTAKIEHLTLLLQRYPAESKKVAQLRKHIALYEDLRAVVAAHDPELVPSTIPQASINAAEVV
jgi:hypothetical protein